MPAIEVYRLKYIDCQALTDLIKPLYEEIYTPQQGNVSVTALVNPNALLLVGRKENVKTVLELAERLDEPVPPQTQFHVFRLRHTAAGTALNTLTDFYTDRGGLFAPGEGFRPMRDLNTLIWASQPRPTWPKSPILSLELDTPDKRIGKPDCGSWRWNTSTPAQPGTR